MKNDSFPHINNPWDIPSFVLQSTSGSHSLCSSCKNATGCTYHKKDFSVPVLECEGLEVETRPMEKRSKKEKPVSTFSFVIENKDSDKFMGLCSNCSNQRTCAFPKPESGIWHCEEYQ